MPAKTRTFQRGSNERRSAEVKIEMQLPQQKPFFFPETAITAFVLALPQLVRHQDRVTQRKVCV